MAKGRQTGPETIYQIMTAWTMNENYSEVARQFDMPLSTVRKIVLENKDKPEFVELCNQKKREFADRATVIIDKALDRLEEDIENREKDIPVNHLTTIIGTLYDKRALAKGESTNQTRIEIQLPKEAEDYAG